MVAPDATNMPFRFHSGFSTPVLCTFRASGVPPGKATQIDSCPVFYLCKCGRYLLQVPVGFNKYSPEISATLTARVAGGKYQLHIISNDNRQFRRIGGRHTYRVDLAEGRPFVGVFLPRGPQQALEIRRPLVLHDRTLAALHQATRGRSRESRR